jgi:hypothetical protein
MTALLLSNLGSKNYKLRILKFVNFKVNQIPIFEGPFLSVQYDESIHAPD